MEAGTGRVGKAVSGVPKPWVQTPGLHVLDWAGSGKSCPQFSQNLPREDERGQGRSGLAVTCHSKSVLIRPPRRLKARHHGVVLCLHAGPLGPRARSSLTPLGLLGSGLPAS